MRFKAFSKLMDSPKVVMQIRFYKNWLYESTHGRRKIEYKEVMIFSFSENKYGHREVELFLPKICKRRGASDMFDEGFKAWKNFKGNSKDFNWSKYFPDCELEPTEKLKQQIQKPKIFDFR